MKTAKENLEIADAYISIGWSLVNDQGGTLFSTNYYFWPVYFMFRQGIELLIKSGIVAYHEVNGMDPSVRNHDLIDLNNNLLCKNFHSHNIKYLYGEWKAIYESEMHPSFNSRIEKLVNILDQYDPHGDSFRYFDNTKRISIPDVIITEGIPYDGTKIRTLRDPKTFYIHDFHSDCYIAYMYETVDSNLFNLCNEIIFVSSVFAGINPYSPNHLSKK